MSPFALPNIVSSGSDMGVGVPGDATKRTMFGSGSEEARLSQSRLAALKVELTEAFGKSERLAIGNYPLFQDSIDG